jgi:hypothetical protein
MNKNYKMARIILLVALLYKQHPMSIDIMYFAPNVFKNVLALSLTKPSVLLMAWFLILVVTLLPSWSVLPELVEPRAVRAESATSLSKIVAWLSFLVADCGFFCL